MLHSAVLSGLADGCIPYRSFATLHPGQQSIKPHTKSTKFLSREAAQESETGVERSGTPGTDKTKTSPEGAAEYAPYALLHLDETRLFRIFGLPEMICSVQLSRRIHNCTLQILRGRDARVPTVHSGG